ncbi:glycosyl transferase family 2 [Bacillus lacus]|uniref:Glycosyl transferase family 2 n=1 Tax=Metabacillus lacus TaxID=1983721 RepID=A0A7X2J2J2_9BACI|nr:glycosyl transferase family 2 [Metabacillus lacus]MRX74190.1 glycosyl transferase family 2 [Metabacillus lacus]
MNKLKVAVYAVCRNEAEFVDRWVNSMGEADLVIVADTGSTDGTVEKLRERGVEVKSVSVQPWRFDMARNAVLNFIPDDFDVCVGTDMDEVFEAGWREKVEKAWAPGTNRLRYMFTWSFHPDGTPDKYFWFEKMHSKHGYRWVHAVHEKVHYYGEGTETYVTDGSVRLNHYPDWSKSRGQYLALLEVVMNEEPDQDRHMFWLGREYMYYGMWDEAIDRLQKHLEMPSAQWKEERAASMRYIARSWQGKGDNELAKQWFLNAIAQAPNARESYVEMARFAYQFQDWPAVYHMVEEALKITEKPVSYLNEGFAWDWYVYDIGAISCYYLGLYSKAEELAIKALNLSPEDQRLKNNLNLIHQKLDKA